AQGAVGCGVPCPRLRYDADREHRPHRFGGRDSPNRIPCAVTWRGGSAPGARSGRLPPPPLAAVRVRGPASPCAKRSRPPAGDMRSIFLPLGMYLVVTLGIPLANGAATRCEFWRHAAEVSAVVAVLLALRMVTGQLTTCSGVSDYGSRRVATSRTGAR